MPLFDNLFGQEDQTITQKMRRTTDLPALINELQSHGITVYFEQKPVKNINFRIKPNALYVSHSARANSDTLAAALNSKLSWIISAHQKLLSKTKTLKPPEPTLWGEVLDVQSYLTKLGSDIIYQDLSDSQKQSVCLQIYRIELNKKLPDLANKWQPIVGKYANEIRLKNMTTRWGTCNTKQARVWLSIHLAAYDYQCTEYVFVHELCHLHHADHSNEFWHEVKKAMPNYKKWHDFLKNGKQTLD